jgi:hypothetical protein
MMLVLVVQDFCKHSYVESLGDFQVLTINSNAQYLRTAQVIKCYNILQLSLRFSSEVVGFVVLEDQLTFGTEAGHCGTRRDGDKYCCVLTG